MTKEDEKKGIIALFQGLTAVHHVFGGMTVKKAEKQAYKDLLKNHSEEYLEELFKDEIEAQ